MHTPRAKTSELHVLAIAFLKEVCQIKIRNIGILFYQYRHLC